VCVGGGMLIIISGTILQALSTLHVWVLNMASEGGGWRTLFKKDIPYYFIFFGKEVEHPPPPKKISFTPIEVC